MHVHYHNEVLVRGTFLLKDKNTIWVPLGTISRLLTEQSPLVNRPCLTSLDDGVTWGQSLCVCPFVPLPQHLGRRPTAFVHPQLAQHAADPLLTGCNGHIQSALGFFHWYPIEMLVKLKTLVPSGKVISHLHSASQS